MEKEIFVSIDYQNQTQLVGRLWVHLARNKESSSFEYDRTWLKNPLCFALDPALSLAQGVHHTPINKTFFGAIGDSAPDRWGRTLMRRAEKRRAVIQNESPKTLLEIDYLLRVNDEARMGALRFSEKKDGPFLADDSYSAIPPLVNLGKLLTASEHVLTDTDSDEELRLLLAPGSSMGGARPKASVRDRNEQLMIAKFPHPGDEVNTVLWEKLALNLATKAKVVTATSRIEKIAKIPVLLLTRFDRQAQQRIPFLSAMSLLGANDHEAASYLDIADAIRQYGASPKEDLEELWRRILFNVLISNTDDHLRNHGFLYVNEHGWRLSPAYDLNPVPTDIKPRILSTYIDLQDGTGTIEQVFSVAEYFNLNLKKASIILEEVKTAISSWRNDALSLGLTTAEINRMESAFELVG